MELYINTAKDNNLVVALREDGDVVVEKKIKTDYDQAEKLLPLIDKVVKDSGYKLQDIKSISVENRGDSFTSLRIGVLTANALAFALDVPVNGSMTDYAKPEYSQEPNIG